MKIVVYGTLKRGYGNNRLLSKATFVKDIEVQGYKLYYCHKDSGFPVARPDPNSSLLGEMFEVDEGIIFNTDRLEGEGVMYNRVRLSDEVGENTYMYVGNHKFWDFNSMTECPKDKNIYMWK